MKKIFLKFLEKELIVVLAVVVLLGILIGYSLAAAFRTTPDLTQPGASSVMRIGTDDRGEEVN